MKKSLRRTQKSLALALETLRVLTIEDRQRVQGAFIDQPNPTASNCTLCTQIKTCPP
jgi:hypothetical protein